MKTRLLTLAALVTIALASCSENEDMAVNVLPEDGVIRVTAGVNNLATRAGADNTNMDQFGLFVTNSTDPDVTKYTYENVYMTKETGTWESCSVPNVPLQMLWNKAFEEVSVVAYSPYSEGTTLQNAITTAVSTDQTVALNSIASDLLYAKSDVTPSDPVAGNDIYYDATLKSLTVKMNHMLSKLRVNIKYGTELTKDGATPRLGDVVLTGTGISYSLNLNSGVVALSTGSNAPTDIKMSKETTDGSNFDAICEAILVPQDAKFSVNITVNDVKYEYTYPDASYTFASGKLYRLDLTVGKDMTPLNEMSSSEWGAGNGTGAGVETE